VSVYADFRRGWPSDVRLRQLGKILQAVGFDSAVIPGFPSNAASRPALLIRSVRLVTGTSSQQACKLQTDCSSGFGISVWDLYYVTITFCLKLDSIARRGLDLNIFLVLGYFNQNGKREFII
jgi:hypothetical protein